MANATNRLTPLKVKSTSKPGYLSDGLGLYLQVTGRGTKSWAFRYERQGKRRELGLGPCHTISLADARQKAADLRRHLIDGKDPYTAKRGAELADKLVAAKALTFDQCAEQYIAAKRPGWKNEKHADQWTSTLAGYASPVFGKLAVADVDTGLVMRVLEPIWATKQETASRLRGRIEAVLDWASSKSYRTGENPARLKGHLDNLLAKINKADRVRHHPALEYKRVGDFMAALRLQAGSAAKALELAVLTACRSGEVRGATWNEIDLDAALWVIPASRMKLKKEHYVPLPGAALALLRTIKESSSNTLIFPGVREGQLSDMTLTQIIRRMDAASVESGGAGWRDGKGEVITAHGFRSTFRDWAGETSSYPREVIEHALAHGLKDKAEAAYARGSLLDKRRKLMQSWADHCAAPQAAATVIPINREAAA